MIRLRAPLACPECGAKVTGAWDADEQTADQRCRCCGQVFSATWPGFPFEPVTVVAPEPNAIIRAERANAGVVNARSNSRAASREHAGEAGFSGQSDRPGADLR